MPLCTPRSFVSASREGRGCTSRSRVSASREGRDCTPRNRFSPCRAGKGCTPRSPFSACRAGKGCTPRSPFSACRGGKGCTPRSRFSPCCEGRGYTAHTCISPFHASTVSLPSRLVYGGIAQISRPAASAYRIVVLVHPSCIVASEASVGADTRALVPRSVVRSWSPDCTFPLSLRTRRKYSHFSRFDDWMHTQNQRDQ